MADERTVITNFKYTIDQASVETVERVDNSFLVAKLRRADEAAKTQKRLNEEADRQLEGYLRRFQEREKAAQLTVEKLNASSFRIEPEAQESISEADRRLQALRNSFDENIERAKQLNEEMSRRASAKVNDAFVGGLRRDLEQVDLPDPTVRDVVGSGDRSGTGRQIARFGNYSQQVLGAVGATGLSKTAGIIGDVAGAATTLNPVLVGITAGVGAMTLVLTAAREATEKTTQAQRDRLSAERDVYQFLTDATTEQTRQRIEEVRRQIAFEQAEYQRIAAERQSFYDQNITSGFDAARQAAGLAFGELNAYSGALDDSSERLSGLVTQYRVLIQAYTGGTQATQDATAAERELAQVRLDAIDRQIQDQIEFARLVRSGTSEGARDRLAAIRDEQYANQEAIVGLQQRNDLTEEEAHRLEELRSANERLNEEYGKVQNVILPAIEAREREQAAIEKAREAQEAYARSLEETFDSLINASEDVQKARDALNRAETEGRANIDRLLQEGRDKRAEVERQVEKSRTEIATKAGEDRAKAEEAAEERRNRILEKYELSREDAVQERNAVARDRAERQRDDELRETDRARDKQIRDIEDALRKQSATIRDRYDEQLRTAQSAQSRALQLEYAKYQYEIDIRQQALDMAVRQYQDFVARLEVISRRLSGQGNVTEERPVPGRITPTAYATGGYLPAYTVGRMNERGVELARDSQGSYVMFNKPMRILDANESRQHLGTTNNVSFNINGVGARQMRAETKQQVIDELDSILTDMGFN